MSDLSRRDFLKLAGAIPASAILSHLLTKLGSQDIISDDSKYPNVIILLFDAMSAKNLSVYGYPRRTTPNLERFAERATVYHRHYAGGNYTIPGVASLLTGTYPWTHRAINFSGTIARGHTENNLFKAVGKKYHRSAFPHTPWANLITTQFAEDIDTLLPPSAFGELDYALGQYFKNDVNMAYMALDEFMFGIKYKPPSMFFGPIQRTFYYRDSNRLVPYDYPKGLPHNVNHPIYFRLDNLFSGVTSFIQELKSPFLAYLHMFPPHSPYRPTFEFNRHFDIADGLPIEKPIHRFSDQQPYSKLKSICLSYDRYLATADDEIGKCLDALEESGIMDNSYVIITSDHGEMFERGESAHSTAMLYDPVVHIPLLVSAPGQKTRKDIHSFTNAVDVLPTLANLTGSDTPTWSEGKLLPEFGGQEDMDRSTFSVEAKINSAFKPFKIATIAMYKGSHKMIYYTGYEPEDSFELYNLEEDLEEMNDLYPSQSMIAKSMRDELLEKFHEVNKPFEI